MQRREFVIAGLAAAAACSAPPATAPPVSAPPPQAQPPQAPASLLPALEAAAAAATGTLCVAVQDIRSGARVHVGGETACPMHSTVKLFVAAWVTREIAEGRLLETQTVTLDAATSPRGVGRIDQALAEQGRLSPTIGAMLEAMLIDSDNASTDGLYRLSDGPSAIASALNLPPAIAMQRTIQQQYEMFGGREPRLDQYQAWLADPADQATPLAFVEALMRLADGKLGNAAADRRTRALMEASPLGADRLKAGLGPAWRLIGRTGTGPTVAGRQTGMNHVGLAVHNQTGRTIAIASFLRDSTGNNDSRAASHAAVGAAVAAAWPNG